MNPARRWVVVGNVANRRVGRFLRAAEVLGVEATAIDWKDVLDDMSALERTGPFTLRLDAPGEDEELAHRLRLLGFDVTAPGEHTRRRADPGELLAPRQHHRGFSKVLSRIASWGATRPDVVFQQPVATILTCFDKPACHASLVAAGVSVPRAWTPHDRASLLDLARERRIWVKLASGSSASGVGVLVRGGQTFMTTLREVGGRRYNAFRVQRLEGTRRDRALDWLLREGVQVEADVPRPRLDGAFFDLRVLVVDGEPRFMIVRQARHPITNLHLGGWRGSVDRLKEALGDTGLKAVHDLTRRVGAVLPAGHLGVDVAIRPGFRDPVVLEVNAFGDLLPGLEMDGLDVPGVQIASRLPKQAGRVLCLA